MLDMPKYVRVKDVPNYSSPIMDIDDMAETCMVVLGGA